MAEARSELLMEFGTSDKRRTSEAFGTSEVVGQVPQLAVGHRGERACMACMGMDLRGSGPASIGYGLWVTKHYYFF